MKSKEEIMKRWDRIRKVITEYPGASAPRDAFESIIDNYEERITELKEKYALCVSEFRQSILDDKKYSDLLHERLRELEETIRTNVEFYDTHKDNLHKNDMKNIRDSLCNVL